MPAGQYSLAQHAPDTDDDHVQLVPAAPPPARGCRPGRMTVIYAVVSTDIGRRRRRMRNDEE